MVRRREHPSTARQREEPIPTASARRRIRSPSSRPIHRLLLPFLQVALQPPRGFQTSCRRAPLLLLRRDLGGSSFTARAGTFWKNGPLRLASSVAVHISAAWRQCRAVRHSERLLVRGRVERRKSKGSPRNEPTDR